MNKNTVDHFPHIVNLPLPPSKTKIKPPTRFNPADGLFTTTIDFTRI